MKQLLLTLTLLIAFSAGFSQNSDKQLAALLESGNLFKLKEEYPKLEKLSSEFMRLYCGAYINSFFNKPAEANQDIQLLLSKYPEQLGGAKRLNMALLMAENFASLQNYKYTASIYEQLIPQLESSGWDNISLQGYKDAFRRYYPLIDVLPLEISYPGKSIKIPLKKDTLGLLTLPVSVGNSKFDFVLDFGAGSGMIPAKYAAALGIRIVFDSSRVQAGTGIQSYTGIGIADEINIGGIRLRNVLFYVAPEEILPQQVSDSLNYKMEGIIGLDVLQALGHLTIVRDKELIVTKESGNAKRPSNMMIYGYSLYVQAAAQNDSLLLMNFDSGGALSSLSKHYLSKEFENKQELLADSIAWASYASVRKLKIYRKKDFQCTIGTKKILFPSINIVDEDISISLPVDGTIGLDVMQQYKKTIVDFQNMYIDFR